MKKIILVILCLLLTGCNYQELNDMGIVEMMAIEYKDNEFNITLELKENKKENEEKSVFYKAKSTSIEKTIEELSLKIDKNLYFIDLNVLIIDSDTANKKLIYIVDYLTRDVMIGTNFNILIDDNLEESIKSLQNKDSTIGQHIKDIFDNQTNSIINIKYDEFLKQYLSEFKDIILPYAKVENNEFIINEAVIFNNKHIVKYISLNMIESYNLLNNQNQEYLYKIEYQNKDLVYKISNHKVKTKYKDNKIIINLDITGSFIEIEDISLQNENNIKDLITILKNNINYNLSEFIDICKENNSELINFKKTYYNKERKKIDSIKNMNYEININIKLDREGLMFNSMGDVYEQNR